MEKILIASMKDNDGIKILTRMDTPSSLEDLKEAIDNELDSGFNNVTVKFFRRTEKWLNSVPEYNG